MRFSFGLALLATAVIAKKGKGHKKADKGDKDFVKFAVKQGKQYKDVGEYKKRKECFDKNHAEVKDLNKKNKGKNIEFADNYTSDMNEDEFNNMLGLASMQEGGVKGASLIDDTVDGKGRNLQTDSNIDWVADGKMIPVKDQGGCGSCWSFAAGAAQEGVQAVKDNADPIRISEQSGVDCTRGSCRYGGWMYYAWDYWTENGAMSNEDYPYTGTDGDCQQDEDSTIVSKTASWGQIANGSSTSSVIEKLADGPMAVAVAAGNNCWRYYKGGILGNASSCRGVFNTRLDHAVTLVAYTAAVDGEGASQEIVEPTCETTTEQSCRKAKRNEKKSGTCRYSNEIMKEYKDRRGRTKKACCVEYETETCDEVAPVSDDGGEVAFWTIQNQWATGWGEAGLMRLEVTGGKGVSGINQVMQWVTVE